MSSEHYCAKHDEVFFKKGKMKSYAHPLKDDEGVTIGWCNEETPPVSSQPDTPMPEDFHQDEPPNAPVAKSELGGAVKRDCKSYCLSYAKDMVVSQDIEPTDVLTYANQFYGWMTGQQDANQATLNLKAIEGKKTE